MVHNDTASSGQGVKLGLMHAIGSSLGSVNTVAFISAMFAGELLNSEEWGRHISSFG